MSYASVSRWLAEHTALEPALLEGAGFETIVAERISAGGGTEAQYVALLDRSSDEVDRLTASIAVPETWLFRYPRSYDLLVEFLVRRLASGHAAPALRMRSVGCATGQEPYCMAMAAIHAGWPAERVVVEGIDRSRASLRGAERAEYGATSIRSAIPSWAVRFLRRDGEAVGLDPAARAVVRFICADAVEPAVWRDPLPWDVIFCRNLLIYLNAGAREQLIESISGALAPGGMLFVGHAEQSVASMRGGGGLRAVAAPHAFALEKTSGAASPGGEERAGRAGRAAARGAPGRTRAPRRPAAVESRSASAASATSRAMPPEREPALQAPESLDDARDLADAGRFEEAERVIGSIVAQRGPSAEALELLGMIRMAANDVPRAKRLFEQAVYLEPARSTSLLQLAMISERSGDTPRAKALWDRATRAAQASDEREGDARR